MTQPVLVTGIGVVAPNGLLLSSGSIALPKRASASPSGLPMAWALSL